MGPFKKTLAGLGGLSVALEVASALVYNRLPDTIPIHWNAAGEVDQLAPKAFIFAVAAGPALVAALGWFVMKFDPLSDNLRRRESSSAITFGVIGFIFLIVFGATISVAQGFPEGIFPAVLFAGIGIGFIVAGNIMPRLKRNYSIGIKLPWALASDLVWAKTHRFGGFAMIICGLLAIIAAFLPNPAAAALMTFSIFGFLIATTLYSYLVFRKEKETEKQ